MVEDFRRVVALCHTAPEGRRPRLTCGLATAFGCTIEGAVDEERVRRIAVEAAEAGADAIMLADTVGYGQPAASSASSGPHGGRGAGAVGGHFHDTRGLGLANVLAALNAGARSFDASLGGLGGCPFAPGATGNIVIEDLVFMLEAMGFDTGVDLDRLVEVRELAHGALPDFVQYGAIAKAGLPKNFHTTPVAQAAE